MVKKRELRNFLSLLRAKEGRKKINTVWIPQNYNRSTNVAMEHNGKSIAVVATINN